MVGQKGVEVLRGVGLASIT